MGADQVNQMNAAQSFNNDVSSLPTRSPSGFEGLQIEKHVFIDDVSAQWDSGITQKLQELVRLELGWDGYRAVPVGFTNAAFALQILARACAPGTPIPTVVPGVEGDLQLEWHTVKGDIELHVVAPNVVHAWCAVASGENPEGEERELKNDFSIVAQWVRDIAQ